MLQSISLKLGLHRKSYTVPYADGAGLLVNRAIFNQLDGFDANFFFYSEECDYCYRVWQAQYAVLFAPSSILMHHRGSSTGGELPSIKSLEMLFKSKIQFLEKNGKQSQIVPMLLIMIFYYIELLLIKFVPALVNQHSRNAWKSHVLSMITCISLLISLLFPSKNTY